MGGELLSKGIRLPPEWPPRGLEAQAGEPPVACPFSDGVFYDPADRLFKLWYMAGWFDSTALAHRRDGIHSVFTTVPANNGKIWYECVDRPDFSVQSVIAPPDFNKLDAIWSKALIAMVTKNGDISGNIAELQKNLEAMIAQRSAAWANL